MHIKRKWIENTFDKNSYLQSPDYHLINTLHDKTDLFKLTDNYNIQSNKIDIFYKLITIR